MRRVNITPVETDNTNFLQNIVDHIPGLVAVYNIHTGKYIYINDSLQKILGYDKKVWLKKGVGFVSSLIHPDDIKPIMQQNAKALKEANSKGYKNAGHDPIISFEYRLKHKNREWIWLKTDGVVFDRNGKGEVEHVMNISVDITKRKEGEIRAGLASTEAEKMTKRAEIVLDTMSDACVILDRKLNYVYVNKRAEQMLHMKKFKLVGKNVYDAIPQAKNTSFPEFAKKAMRTQKTISYDSYSEILKKWVEVKYFPSPEGLAFYFSDITERKKAEEDRTKLAAIVKDSNDAIISKNLNSIVTSWNAAAEKMFGYKEEEMIGKSIRIIIPNELRSQEDEIIMKLKKGKRIEHFETVRITKDGRKLDVALTISPIKNAKGEIIGASKIARNITEQKLLEKQRDDFISIATHELKTPVTSVKAYAQVLHSLFIKKQDSKSAEYLSKMDAQLNKLTNLISDLLDVNKIQSGQMQFRPSFFDLDVLISEVVEEMQRTSSRHKLIKKLSKGKKIYGDRDRIGQVLVNLLSNAIKYSPKANKVIISNKFSKDSVTVFVQDFGIGIEKDKKDKVFEKFFRISGPGNETFPGMGLGLHISAEFVRRQGGRIWVESITGKGSIFCFALPINSSDSNSM
jgi:PAS domain S-box-containing protein